MSALERGREEPLRVLGPQHYAYPGLEYAPFAHSKSLSIMVLNTLSLGDRGYTKQCAPLDAGVKIRVIQDTSGHTVNEKVNAMTDR